MECCGVDHHSHEYTPQQRADLDLVLAFNHELADALDAGRDIRGVQALLDPDPLRYMWVDEGAGKVPAFLDQAGRALRAAPDLAGHDRVTGSPVSGADTAARPSVAVTADGHALFTWLEWTPDRGDRVVAHLDTPTGPARTVLTPEPADCFRPTALFDATGTPWVLYARADGGAVAVYAQRWSDGRWGPPERVSTTEHPSFNQEAVAHPDGRVEVIWQGRQGGRFGAWSRIWGADGWEPANLVSTGPAGNVWDPAIAALPDGGTAYAWTEYVANSYRTVVSTPGAGGPGTGGTGAGGPGTGGTGAGGPARVVRPLTSGTDYALHPSLAVTSDGALWCAFDVITVQGHGGSGPTRLRPVEELAATPQPTGARPPGEFIPSDLLPDVSVVIRVVRIAEDGVFEAEGTLAGGLDVTPAGMPRLAADGGGGLTVAYRVHRRLPLMTYYWEVAAQTLGPRGWSAPTTFRGSDGTAEEVAVAGLLTGAVVCWQTDGRLDRALSWTEGFGGRECPHLLEHQGAIIWHALHGPGEVRQATLPGSGPAVASRLVTDLRSDQRVEVRRWRAAEVAEPRSRHRVGLDGSELTVYWGDLHRHSLISRCTSGDEPSLEDFYRYAWDVCDYDFWAVTDHSENSSAYQWWGIQKIADLFTVDGHFAPFYGFEWTGTTGHQNVIYASARRGAPIYSSYAEGTQTPDELWAQLRKQPDHPALTIPHHPGSAMVPYDWGYHDPDHLRVVEIFQACRGNYEDDGCYRQYADGTLPGTFVLDGLRRGHRFGFIASSDHGNGASFLGVYAERLDRASLFEAIQQRRVFAATTRDVLVETRIGDTFMGGETRSRGPVEFDVLARGYRDLAGIDVVRDGEVISTVRPPLDVPAGWLVLPLRLEWGRGGAVVDWSGQLTVTSGHVLRTPFWSPEITAVTDREVAWSASTRSFGVPYGAQRGGVELTVIAPAGATVEVRTRHGQARITAADLATTRVDVPVTAPGAFSIGPGTGGLTSLGGREHRLRITDQPTGPAWYYARVYQVDGEMAWSSPIWVEPS